MLCSVGYDYVKTTETVFCNIGKYMYNDTAMGYFSAILENIMARRRDNALQYWKVKSCEILGWNEECPYEEALFVY